MAASEPVGEDKRLALMNRLTEALGEEEARTLMESLPPVLWTHLATKDDVKESEERLRTDFNGQFAQLNAKIDSGFANIESKFANIESKFANIDGKFADVDGRFGKIDGAFENLRAETTLQLAKQTRTMAFMLVGFALSIWIPFFVLGLS